MLYSCRILNFIPVLGNVTKHYLLLIIYRTWITERLQVYAWLSKTVNHPVSDTTYIFSQQLESFHEMKEKSES